MALSVAFIAAWVVIVVRRAKNDPDREPFITDDKGVVIGTLGIIFGLALLVASFTLQNGAEGLTWFFVMLGMFTGPWVFVLSTVWFWRSI